MPIVEFHLDVPNATPRTAFDYMSNWPQTLVEWDPSIKEAKQTSQGTPKNLGEGAHPPHESSDFYVLFSRAA